MSAVLVICCSPVYAQMMQKSVGVKVDYIHFADSDLDDFGVDTGTYIGLEGYTSVLGGLLQVGGEIGYTNPDGSVTTGGVKSDIELEFIPIEANAKFVGHLGENLSYAIGLGISFTLVDIEVTTSGTTFKRDDTIWGGQVFGELNYTIGNLILGLDVKHHLTESYLDDDYNNTRVGAHIGWKF